MTDFTQDDKIKIDGNEVIVFVERIYCADHPRFKDSQVVGLCRLGAMVTLYNEPPVEYETFNVGDAITVDGRNFTIGNAPNNNYTLEAA